MNEVTFVTHDCQVIVREIKNRPVPSRLIYRRPEGAKFVMRFFPRLRKWRVYDVRKYILNPSFGQFYRAPPPSFETEERERAIAYAIVMP